MMPAMCVRSSISSVGCTSALEHNALALDRTRVNVQTKNAAETANQAKNSKQNKKNRKNLFLLLLLLETWIK
jgi:hypothetical protein